MLTNDEKAESYCDEMGYWIASGIVPLQNIWSLLHVDACTQLGIPQSCHTAAVIIGGM